MSGRTAVARPAATSADESGAVLILYAVVLVVMLMMVAIVTDLGAMRADIRQTQSVSDMAATAGALSLAPEAEGTPSDACRAAWRYVIANVPTASGATDPCAPFVDYDDPPSCPETDQYVTAALGEDHEATIMWPVSDDVVGGTDSVIGFAPWSGGHYDTEVDGPRCERLLVRIQRTRGFIFGNALAGVASGTVARPAVARGGANEITPTPPVLVVLNPHGCETLTASGAGAGYIHVAEGLDKDGNPPGVITVDSDGSECGSGKYTMDISGSNAVIWAGVAPIARTPPVRDGAIESYALRTEWSERSYNPALVNANRLVGGLPEPKHPVAAPRRTRQPWEHRYDCRAGYATSSPTHVAIDNCEGTGHITQLRTRINLVTELGTRALRESAAVAAGYEVYSDNCNIDSGSHTLPTDKKGWYFDCERLRVGSAATVTIPRGDVIIRGGPNNNHGLAIQGTLRINDGSGGGDSIVVVRRGHLDKGGSGGLVFGKSESAGVFVYLPEGRMTVQGNDNQPFDWYAPYGDPESNGSGGCNASEGGSPPEETEFQNLGLWSIHAGGSSSPQVLGGGVSNLNMEGIFYMPNSHFDFGGSGEMSQQKAQFVAYQVKASGNGTLRVAPDPSRMLAECTPATALIR
jgi:Flp pilus assembly protein TadG